jgi:hypothetical protein
MTMNAGIAGKIVPIAYALLLSACASPFSDKLSGIEWTGEAKKGTIAVSQPKVYQRASLVNERKLKERWLGKLVEKVPDAKFTPQIAREIEQITTFAMALGLSFDPASAIGNKRESATGELQQKIDVLKLQSQLAQLEQKLIAVESGTAPKPDGDTGVAGTSTPDKGSAVPASSQQLQAAIEKLAVDLSRQFGTVGQGQPAPATFTASPEDDFHDRITYLGQLEAARNAASLDDTHDLGGRALIRLNFQATVLPDRRYSKVPGVIQMKIVQPHIKPERREQIYRQWLAHINQKINRATETDWELNDDILNSAVADNFDLVEYRYSVATGKGSAEQGPLDACSGLVSDVSSTNGQCKKLVFAVSKFDGASMPEGAYATLEDYKKWFALDKVDEETDRRTFRDNRRLIAQAGTVVRQCSLPKSPPAPTEGFKLYHAVKEAEMRVAAGDIFETVDRTARRILRTQHIDPPTPNAEQEKIVARTARARLFLSTFVMRAYQGCSAAQIKDFYTAGPRLHLPPSFQAALDSEENVAVYEVGPREQVQRVSSISRIADNLSLAAALAASAPRAGVGANVASNYSRQAVGKADTIERIPAVIGYAVPDGTFGWVLGPTAVFDPRGDVQLEQTPRTVDLSVDLSVPGWWPSFTINMQNMWGSDPTSITTGKIGMPGQKPVAITVDMRPNYADFDLLTARLMLGGGINGDRQVSLDDRELRDQFVSACKNTTLYLSGSNIWRATSTLIGGRLVDDTEIKVAPDMSGILVTVPPLGENPDGLSAGKLDVSVFTRYGPATAKVNYIPKSSAGECKGSAQTPQVAGR